MVELIYYVAALGTPPLRIAALRPATTSAAASASLLGFVLRFLFRILPLFTLNPLSLFKNFFDYFYRGQVLMVSLSFYPIDCS